MSIANEISRLTVAKTAIASAIANKGVTVPGATKLDGYAGLIAQIEGGGTPSPQTSDVNFYDYDGTLLYSYTIAEANALTALPAQPTYAGLTGQGWNYTLAQVNAFTRAADVGATYITDDGKTRLYIKIYYTGRATVPLYFSQTIFNGVTIDWGDGTATETVAGTGNMNISHAYATVGNYCITLTPTSGCTLGVGNSSNATTVIGGGNYGYRNLLQRVEIGDSVTSIGTNAFYNCSSLSSVTIPDSVTSIGTDAFYNCYSLSSVTIPDSVTSIGTNAFYRCYSLSSVTIPYSVTSIGGSAFEDCYSLSSVTIPDSVTSIGSGAFYNCYFMKDYYLLPSTPPTLANTNAFSSIPADCVMHVPAASLNAYKTATNWATYANRMVGDL